MRQGAEMEGRIVDSSQGEKRSAVKLNLRQIIERGKEERREVKEERHLKQPNTQVLSKRMNEAESYGQSLRQKNKRQ